MLLGAGESSATRDAHPATAAQKRARCAKDIRAIRDLVETIPSDSSSTPPHSPSPLLSEVPDLDWFERRALSYFQDRTALELAGAFQTDFWLSHILPLARQERSVSHALVALSGMHEHYSGVDHYSPIKGVDFALEHYGRAMREVVGFKQSNPTQSFEYALVTCALFSTFESLQGQYHEACSHAISGIKILAEEQQRLVGNQIQTLVPREALARFFIASGRQILELGDNNFPGTKPEIYLSTKEMPIPEQFTSYEDALLHMELLLGEVIDYVGKSEDLATQGPISDDLTLALMTEFHGMKMGFERWRSAFDLFSASDSNELSRETPESLTSSSSSPLSDAERARPPRSPAFLILKVYHCLMTAFLARIESNDESVFDEFVPDLWSALDAAEEFIQCTSTYVSPLDKTSTSRSPLDSQASDSAPSERPQVLRPTFSLALGIVPTLFLIASRTSTLAVREKALSLLRTCNRREGLWDSNLAAKLVDRILDLRELAKQMETQLDEPLDISTIATSQLQEQTRHPHQVEFKLFDIKFLPGRRCVLRYSFVRHTGEKLIGVTIPGFSDHERLLPATRQYQGEYWEELSWEG